ncbi:MAG: hypothetical protein Q8L78_06940 [Coxiellaceae bacterium]|nr:hypothetical protein [Coxiellaceae bacterium]
MLKPQDIVILLKIISVAKLSASDRKNDSLSQNKLALLLCMSPSEINAGIKRLMLSGLLAPTCDNDTHKIVFLPVKEACLECLIFAVKYFFPAQLGVYTRGIPTAYAAPLFKKLIVLGADPVPVWPHAEGSARGISLKPLYRSVPSSLIQHPDTLFYELLVLLDTMRIGKAREKNIAIQLLREKLDAKVI